MNRKQRAHIVGKILDQLYPNPPISLDHRDPYTLLVAVMLSAQSTDARVNRTTPKLFAKASSPEEMIKLSPNEIEKIIKPCGLAPTKSKAIWMMSKLLIERHKGKVPKTFKELEALPGVGHKSAAVLLSQAFNIPAIAVDTHIHRCAKRWGLSNGKNVVQTEKDLMKLFPKKVWSKLHLQMIYFAREYCPAKGHHIEDCPICQEVRG